MWEENAINSIEETKNFINQIENKINYNINNENNNENKINNNLNINNLKKANEYIPYSLIPRIEEPYKDISFMKCGKK